MGIAGHTVWLDRRRVDFSEYVAARRASLVRAVVLLGCPVSDAEDIVQTALLKCHRSWRRVQRANQPEAYVYRVLVNTYRDTRSRRWTGEVPTEELPEEPVDSDHLTGIEVRRALASMSRDHREVLVLRYFADLSEAQTAKVLGIPTGTAKSRTSRALAVLSAHPSLRSPNVY
jgi:RNA polymerase sigma-70 factor (sigma-E family)